MWRRMLLPSDLMGVWKCISVSTKWSTISHQIIYTLKIVVNCCKFSWTLVRSESWDISHSSCEKIEEIMHTRIFEIFSILCHDYNYCLIFSIRYIYVYNKIEYSNNFFGEVHVYGFLKYLVYHCFVDWCTSISVIGKLIDKRMVLVLYNYIEYCRDWSCKVDCIHSNV